MNALVSFLVSFLLNSLWQVPLLWAAAWLSAKLLRRHRPQVVHRLWCWTLLAQAGLPALTAEHAAVERLAARALAQKEGLHPGSVTVTFGAASGFDHLSLGPAVMEGLALAYGLYLLVALGKLAHGLCRTARLSSAAKAVDLDATLQAAWDQQRTRFGLAGIRLLQTPAVQVPSTVGIFRRCVLLPPGLLSRVEIPDAEVVFAHECAHMQRRDFFWNALQQLLALPVSYHPVLRSTQGHLAESRKWICDDLAAEAAHAPQVYARSLLRLAAQLRAAAPVVPQHAIGMLDANALERRIMRLTQRIGIGTALQRAGTLTLAGMLELFACGSAWAGRTGVLMPAPQTAAGEPVRISGGVMAGQVLTKVNPVYPPEAKAQGLEGSVVLSAVISSEGTVEQLNVVSGPEELSRAAIDAVRQWTYKPFLLHGTPTEVSTTITVNFKLQQ